MVATRTFQTSIWIGTLLFVGIAFYVWWPSTQNLTPYSLFPIFGLIAFTLMWLHYVVGALRTYLQLPTSVVATYFKITSYIVLLCILFHPFIFYVQLYLDGLGLPYQAVPSVYPKLLEQLAVYAGVVALLCFLAFELHRVFKNRSWWKYIEWANIAAMILILWHGFTLGGELRQPWFMVVWGFYAITFICAVGYSRYSKQRSHHGSKERP